METSKYEQSELYTDQLILKTNSNTRRQSNFLVDLKVDIKLYLERS